MEHTAIFDFKNEQGNILVLALGFDIELQDNLKFAVLFPALRIDIHLYLNVGLNVALKPLLGGDVFKRQIPDELPEYLHLWRFHFGLCGFGGWLFGHRTLLNN